MGQEFAKCTFNDAVPWDEQVLWLKKHCFWEENRTEEQIWQRYARLSSVSLGDISES